MKSTFILLIAAGALCLTCPAFSQEKKSGDAEKPKGLASDSDKEKPKATAEELEAKFKATLTKATMTGRWCSIKEGVLGPEKEDKYTIVGVTKLKGDDWVINARIEYNKKEIVAPIPVQVKWPANSPVPMLTRLGTPT